jgi:hypothetical protein
MDSLAIEAITNLPISYIRSSLVAKDSVITWSRRSPQSEEYCYLRRSICLQVVRIDFISNSHMFASAATVPCMNHTFAGTLLLACISEVQHVDYLC